MSQSEDKQLLKLLNDLKDPSIIINIIPRSKNRVFRHEQGITIEQVEEIIRSIEISDYYQGPENDRDPDKSGSIYKFKKFYNGIYLYIKLKETIIIEKDEVIICISCHEFNMHD